MKISQKPWATALIFIGVAAAAVVAGVLLQHFVRRPDVFSHVAQADRVVIYPFYDEQDPRITYTGVELSEIIAAIQNSRRDRGKYPGQVGEFVMDFYKGEAKIATVRTGSGWFIADGKQYRPADDTLILLVDKVILPAIHKRDR